MFFNYVDICMIVRQNRFISLLCNFKAKLNVWEMLMQNI